MWLSISARFIDGQFHGRTRDRQPEWPPSPHRLFSALVAAANSGHLVREFGETRQDAFRWLERLPAPEIVAAAVAADSSYRLYVPNNERTLEKRRAAKTLYTRHIGGDATVHYLWPVPDSEAAGPHVDYLCQVAQFLHSLGHGIDMVVGGGQVMTDAERQRLVGETWLPAVGSISRAPAPGLLAELMERHAWMSQIHRGRTISKPPVIHKGRWLSYVRRSEQARAVYAFSLSKGDGRLAIDPCRTIGVAAWLRCAAHKCARDMELDAEFIEGYVCGHGQDPNRRLSYLPLPTIPPKGRDGRIRRVLIAEPAGSREGQELARELAGEALIDERRHQRVAQLSPTDPRSDNVVARYLKTSRRWGTVTPLVLPGRGRRSGQDRSISLVHKALAHAGITTPVADVRLQSGPLFAGAEEVQAYGAPPYLQEYPRMHAVIEFAEPVIGPLAIGSGRHIGLGLMAPTN